MMHRMSLLVLALVVGFSSAAEAYTLGSARGSGREITALGRGVKEIGLDNIMVLGYDKFSGDNDFSETAFRMTYLGGLTFRYFLMNNLALTLQAQGLYRKLDDASKTVGFLGAVGASYYMRLGYGLFFSPGIAAGGYVGTNEVEAGTSGGVTTILSRSEKGGLGRVDFSFVYYVGHRFNLRAGPEFIFFFGNSTADGTPDLSVFQMEGGFKVGFSYVF